MRKRLESQDFAFNSNFNKSTGYTEPAIVGNEVGRVQRSVNDEDDDFLDSAGAVPDLDHLDQGPMVQSQAMRTRKKASMVTNGQKPLHESIKFQNQTEMYNSSMNGEGEEIEHGSMTNQQFPTQISDRESIFNSIKPKIPTSGRNYLAYRAL